MNYQVSERAVLVVGLVATWVGVLVRLPLVSFAFIPLCLVFLVRRRFREAALLVLLSPLTFMAAMAAVKYVRGTARLIYVGLPETGFHNPDPDLRIPRQTMGDLVSGDEWMAIVPNNATLRALSRVFGTMPRAYTGPYPDRDAVVAALAGAPAISVDRLRADVVALGGREHRLDAGVGRGLLKDMRSWDVVPPPDDAALAAYPTSDPPQAVLVGERCLVLRIPLDPWGPLRAAGITRVDDIPARIALVDLQRGRPFAFYAPKAGSDHRYPPVSWDPE